MADPRAAFDSLALVLRDCEPAAVAVSGGVDSMTLAHASARVLGAGVSMYHAVSPAVPPVATERVERHAKDGGWDLKVLSAGEFDDPRYLANPAERCFFCKHNLYAALGTQTESQLLSGTNLDDLGDWRPGLRAASEHDVRHPYVEAGIDKAGVRALASWLGLDDLAALPAAPCLSSRVETGLRIKAPTLEFIDVAETLVRESLKPATVRCRVRREGIVIELDNETYEGQARERTADLRDELAQLALRHGVTGDIEFAPYVRGSAFLRGN